MFSGLTNQVSSWMGAAKGEPQDEEVPTPTKEATVEAAVEGEKQRFYILCLHISFQECYFKFSLNSRNYQEIGSGCAISAYILVKLHFITYNGKMGDRNLTGLRSAIYIVLTKDGMLSNFCI